MEQTKEHKERNKGGRPKKEATEKLKYRIAVKMTAADYFRLLTRSHEAGVSPSEYMRECFRNGHVKERLSEEHAGYIRQLCGMANNLNQLARKANAGGFHDERWSESQLRSAEQHPYHHTGKELHHWHWYLLSFQLQN